MSARRLPLPLAAKVDELVDDVRTLMGDLLGQVEEAAAGSGVILRQDAVRLVRKWRDDGFKVVLTNGCFDLLHTGHVRYLQAARALGDRLVVGVNSDESVRGLKGPDRPILPEAERAEVLATLRCVDAVVVFDEATASDLMLELAPHIYAKGGDYTPDSLPETPAARRVGARIAILPFVDGRSTTSLIAAIETSFIERQKKLWPTSRAKKTSP